MAPNQYYQVKQKYVRQITTPAWTPSALKNELDKYVVGQDQVTKDLSTLVVNHLVSIQYNSTQSEDARIKSANAFLVGGTGTGKTYIISKLAEILNIPFMSVDITAYTQSGYVGRDLDDIYEEYIQLCSSPQFKSYSDKFSQTVLPTGIIFIDEMDKIGTNDTSGSVSTVGVQRQLLKLLEPSATTTVYIKEGSSRHSTYFLDTRNVLWLFSGAFTNLIKDKKKKLKGSQYGLTSGTKATPELVIDQELLKESGLYSELLGRINHVFALNDLTEDQYYEILTKPVGCIKEQMIHLFKAREVDMNVTDDDWRSLASQAYKLKLGARALKTVVEKHFFDQLYT